MLDRKAFLNDFDFNRAKAAERGLALGARAFNEMLEQSTSKAASKPKRK